MNPQTNQIRNLCFVPCRIAIALIALVASALSPLESWAKDAVSEAENAATRKVWESWNAPIKPFRIVGNIYYVGATGVSSFLMTTPQGNILLDTGFESTVPRIRESISQLGFSLSNIKILLNSHAHLDHAGGHALMKELTGAKIIMSEQDAILLASGGTNDVSSYPSDMMRYRPAWADQIVKDGDTVSLGGTDLRCHLTPGHTKGCTTWSMSVVEDGKPVQVVFFGSTSILPGVPLLKNPKYPTIVDDFRNTYRKLKSLPCDVFLAPHGGFFGLSEKCARLERGEKPNPFIDFGAFGRFVEQAERNFVDQLEKEQRAP